MKEMIAGMSSGTTAAAKHGHRVAKTMPGLPSGTAQKVFSAKFQLVITLSKIVKS